MQPKQQRYSSLRHQLSRTFLATTLLASSQLLYGINAIAAPAPAGQIIQNKATGSFVDTDSSEKAIESNIVQVTVAEITGINIAALGVTGTPYFGNTVYFDFTVTNIGNDPTQFFIPNAPSSITGGTAGTIQIIAYDSDGSGPTAPIPLTVNVPSGSPTGSLTGSAAFNNGSIPAGGTITVRVPVTVTATGNNPITVTLGNTPAAPNNQNQDFIIGTNDLYTVDNTGTTNGDLVSGDPLNGDAATHRKEASDTLSVNAIPNITGLVFEDVNYGGGNGRAVNTTGTKLRPNVTVELYKSDGTFIASTTTSPGGQYKFTNVTPNADYIVRVVNTTVTSSRGTSTGLIPVQTFRTDASVTAGVVTQIFGRVGGEKPQEVDAPARSGTQTLATLNALPGQEVQSVTTVKVANTDITDIDFGYNFDTIVNTNDSGQGSLRQFITNSNALTNAGLDQVPNPSPASGTTAVDPAAGEETSIFMIPSNADPLGRTVDSNFNTTTGVAELNLATGLTITDTFTTINAGTQTVNIGNTNSGKLGIGASGTYRVGTGSDGIENTGDEPILSAVEKPEVQIKGQRNAQCLFIANTATNTVIKGLSIYSCTDAIGMANTTRVLIQENILGASATSFTDPGAGVRNSDQGVGIWQSSYVNVNNNLVGFNGGMGVWVLSTSNNVTVQNNEVRNNAHEVVAPSQGLVLDGIEVQGSNNTISGNLSIGNFGNGIDNINGITGNQFLNNTLEDNGIGFIQGSNANPEGSGIRVYGSQQTIKWNIIRNNRAPGLLALGDAKQNTISQNSMYGNAQVGIDLRTETSGFPAISAGTAPYVSPNDGLATTGGNNGVDYPVITSSTLSGGTLTVKGFVGSNPAGSTTFANAKLEFFIADNSPADQNGEVILGDGESKPHGEGKTFLPPDGGTCTADSNGLFTCTFSTAGALGLTNASNITATATDSTGSTSEFSSSAVTNPNVVLVKRITRVNGQTTSYLGDNLAAYNEELSNIYDDNAIELPIGNPPATYPDTDKWPNTTGKTASTFLLGGTNGGFAKPGDEVEYTIYFLSTGDQTARNIQFCDRIPDHQTFVPNSFSTGLPVAPGGLNGPRGISVQQNGTERAYTNIGGDDTARFYDPNGTFPAICNGSIVQTENNGAVFVDLGDVPNATTAGTPGSYGFVRFRVKMK